MVSSSGSPVDPTDSEMLRRRDAKRASRWQTKGFIHRCKTRIAGGRFVAIGVFGAAMAAGFFDHQTLRYSVSYWEGAGFLWRPEIAVPLFVLCYTAFLWLHSWHARNPPGPDLPEEPVHPGLWVPLGIGSAAMVFAGSISGLMACAAALILAAWIFAYRLGIGTMWSVYPQVAVLLALSGIVPPALGWPIPNLFATIFLGGVSLAMLIGGTIDHVQYYRFVRKARAARETSEVLR